MEACKKCGEVDTLVRGICAQCLALEMDKESADNAIIEGEQAGLYENLHEGRLVTTVENMRRQAILYQPVDKKVRENMLSALNERKDKVLDIMNQAGITTPNERVNYRADIEKIVEQYERQLDNGEYRVCKADIFAEMKTSEVVDTFRGLVVYKQK